MSNFNLMLHCGAKAAELQQIQDVKTPEKTETWHPIPHTSLIDMLRIYLPKYNMSIVKSAHGLTNDGMRYFGLFEVESVNPTDNNQDFTLIFGLRNSHDKTFPAGLCLGNGVFVCDNLSFSAEIVIGRRHTKYIMQDLPRLMAAAVGKLVDARVTQENRIATYKEVDMSDEQAAHFLLTALETKAVNTTRVPKVWEQWKNPNHKEFREERNAWRLMNAFTEVYKGVNPMTLPTLTTKLHGLLDGHCGIGNLTVGDRVAEDIIDAEAVTITER